MRVESRDSVSLKPAELDEFGQLLASVELPMKDDALDDHIERFPLVTSATTDDELYGFLFGSLERIGGTPCILWGMGAIRRGRQARPTLDALVGGPDRRAATSSPDGDARGAGRPARRRAYALLNQLPEVCPRRKSSPRGEERAWGRRLARRFGCDSRYDDRKFRLKANAASAAVLHAAAVKAGGKAAAEVVGAVRPHKGEAESAFGWATGESRHERCRTPAERSLTEMR